MNRLKSIIRIIKVSSEAIMSAYWIPLSSVLLAVNLLYDVFLPITVSTPIWATVAGWIGMAVLVGGTIVRPAKIDISSKVLLWIVVILWTMFKIQAFAVMIGYPSGGYIFESLFRYKRMIAPSLANLLTAAVAVCTLYIYIYTRRQSLRDFYDSMSVWGRRSFNIAWFLLAGIYIILLQYIIVTVANDSSVEIALYKFFSLTIKTVWVYLLIIFFVVGEILALYLTTNIFSSQSSFQLMVTRIIIYIAIAEPLGWTFDAADVVLIMFIMIESTLLLIPNKVQNYRVLNMHVALIALYIALLIIIEHRMGMSRYFMTSLLDFVSFVVYLYLIFIGGCSAILYIFKFPFQVHKSSSKLIGRIRLVIVGVVLLAMILVSTVIITYSVNSYESRRQYSIMYNMQEVFEVYYSQVINIVNIFVLILILSIILSGLLYRRISKPLTALSEGIKNIKRRKRIDYPVKREGMDEIGTLIEQYNDMIGELEDYYRQMARIEREGAWREMARQVAHEIKNPLTPMLLKVQMLQRMKADGKPGWEAKIDDTCSTIVDNIYMLRRIADEFSDFARIVEGQQCDVDIDMTIRGILPLYTGYSNIRIEYQNLTSAPAITHTDPGHIRSAFINLIKNAVEAISESKEGLILITLQDVGGMRFRVSVSDNGVGVPEELLTRIFEPNFTTKSKGSGIGLSIAKRIIEHSSGNLSIESVMGEGTTMIVELPYSALK